MLAGRAGGFIAAALIGAGVAHAAPPDFERDIKPILEAHCTGCHGAAKQKAGLRLDVRKASLFDEGTLTAGQPDKSELYKLLVSKDDKERMPQDAPALAPEKIALVRAWIEAGAAWPETVATGQPATNLHWAYVKPKRPTPPPITVKAWRGARNPIDAFVAARLEKAGLAPSPPAAPEILLRRVYLDLTGLPPAPADTDAFVAATRTLGTDKAFARVVEQLLASPRYGERWARVWLDLARYADSNGFEKDNLRSMWPYRDWVVRAFNRDLPFDQFTIEQIAGDMLPNATVDQQIASGFNANTMLNEEGGVDANEARFEVMVDRVNTTTSVWLGSTMGCAQCHNHKYDPFSQKDYYRMMAFFNNGVTYKGNTDGNGQPLHDPTLLVPDAKQQKALQALERAIAEQKKIIEGDTPALAEAEAAWVAEKRALGTGLKVITGVRSKTESGARLTARADGALVASGKNASNDSYEIVARLAPGAIAALRLEVLPDPSLPEKGPGRAPNGQFMLSRVRVFAAPAADPGKKLAVELFDPIDTVVNGTAKIAGVLDEDPETGWAPGSKIGEPSAAMFKLRGKDGAPVGFPGGTVLTVVLDEKSVHPQHGLGCFRLSVSADPGATAWLGLPGRIRDAITTPDSARSADDAAELTRHFRTITPLLERERVEVKALGKKIEELKIPATLVLQEMPGFSRPSSFVYDRGAFVSPTEKVFANTPAILPPMPDNLPANRLGLAQWLVSKDNPLTGRVLMNRIWETYFGRGLVATMEDFGTRGELPTHPELLDFLATELYERGLSLKAMHRLIVSSATYQQDSRVSPRSLEKDPYNELLSRGPRFRVEAETIRDIALAASGLLSTKMGGPSVMPPQPEGVWDVPYNSKLRWEDATGEDRFRRALYTFIRRSAAYPLQVTFDGTAREVCTLRRIRTNTPLQSLQLLNDPAFVEMARGLAERMAREAGNDPRARLAHGFRLVTGRKASARELTRLLSLYEQERTRFARAEAADAAGKLLAMTRAASAGEPATRKLGKPADAAAWTLVSNVLLNLDETQTKE